MKYKVSDWVNFYSLITFCCLVGGFFNVSFLLQIWAHIDTQVRTIIGASSFVFLFAAFLNFKSAESLARARRDMRVWPGF